MCKEDFVIDTDQHKSTAGSAERKAGVDNGVGIVRKDPARALLIIHSPVHGPSVARKSRVDLSLGF